MRKSTQKLKMSHLNRCKTDIYAHLNLQQKLKSSSSIVMENQKRSRWLVRPSAPPQCAIHKAFNHLAVAGRCPLPSEAGPSRCVR